MRVLQTARTNSRVINSLLIAVVLFVALVPAHYHLHHLGDADADLHEHAIDLHLITANADQSHHDEDTSIFSATPDVIVKKASHDLSAIVIVALLLLLLAVSYRLSTGHGSRITGLNQRHPYFTPPLRAPPSS